MNPGRSQLSIVIDVQVLITNADSVATMAREVGHPRVSAARRTGVISSRNEGRLPGLVDRITARERLRGRSARRRRCWQSCITSSRAAIGGGVCQYCAPALTGLMREESDSTDES